MVNSGVMRHRVLGITNSDKYVILSSTELPAVDTPFTFNKTLALRLKNLQSLLPRMKWLPTSLWSLSSIDTLHSVL